jgi:hypothetical protein
LLRLYKNSLGNSTEIGVVLGDMKPKERANGKLKPSTVEDWNKETKEQNENEKGKSKQVKK